MSSITVKTIPGAGVERIVKEASLDGEVRFRVYVKQPAEDGKANKAVLAALARYFRIDKTDLEILKGQTSRTKVISINLPASGQEQ